jgi:hypothetical protein
MTKRRAYAGDRCGHHIYPCVGTIFEKSRTKLTHWMVLLILRVLILILDYSAGIDGKLPNHMI